MNEVKEEVKMLTPISKQLKLKVELLMGAPVIVSANWHEDGTKTLFASDWREPVEVYNFNSDAWAKLFARVNYMTGLKWEESSEMIPRPSQILLNEEVHKLELEKAIERHSGYFGLRGFPGRKFMVSKWSSYWSDLENRPLLYTCIWNEEEQQWLSFAKGTEEELAREKVKWTEPTKEKEGK